MDTMFSFDPEPKETHDQILLPEIELGIPKQVYSDERITIIDQFLTPSSCSSIRSWIDTQKENVHLNWIKHEHKFARHWESSHFDSVSPPNCSINPCWRFIRLNPNQYLSSHVDAKYVKSVDCYSVYTVMIYLNDSEGDLEIIDKRIQAKEGRLVMFHQNLVHRGIPHSTFKYYMRSEFMYTRNPRIENDRDREAIRILREARALYYTDPVQSRHLEEYAFDLCPELENLLF